MMTVNGVKIKKSRQARILDIIEKNVVTTQEELTQRLKEDGFEATQATVSRDIRELKLTKTTDDMGNYKYIATSRPSDDRETKYLKILKEATVSIKPASNLIVIKTFAGMANAACAAIDALEWQEIIGSLAGDDTIFIACESKESAEHVKTRIELMF